MKTYLFVVGIALCFLLHSCSKKPANDTPVTPVTPPDTTVVTPPVTPPVPGDALFLWKKVDWQANGDDIYFTSPAKGFYVGDDDTIRRSLDSGKTWSAYAQGVQEANMFIFIDKQYGFELGYNSQIAVTKDGGDTWAVKRLPAQANTATFTSPLVGYMCDMQGKIYKTSDGCNTWTNVNSSLYSEDAYIFSLTENNGFMVLKNGDFYKTTDGFVTLQQVSTNITSDTLTNLDMPYNTLLFQDAQTGYYACEKGLLKTTDGGVTWEMIKKSHSPQGNSQVNIVRFPTANTAYYSCDYYIYKTTDAGNTWALSCQLARDIFLDIMFYDDTTGWAIGNGVYRLSK